MEQLECHLARSNKRLISVRVKFECANINFERALTPKHYGTSGFGDAHLSRMKQSWVMVFPPSQFNSRRFMSIEERIGLETIRASNISHKSHSALSYIDLLTAKQQVPNKTETACQQGIQEAACS